jgi:preprotein translocase subunit SecD
MTKRYKGLFIILVVLIVAVAVWIDWPDNPGIHIGETYNKEIETRLGLDLVGGVQALLEADLPQETEIESESMRTATTIVENRVNGLGVTEAVVQQAGDRRIVVELPGETDPDRALETLQQTGLLEFVDFSQLTPEEYILVGESPIRTDFGLSDSDEPQIEDTSSESISDTEEVGIDDPSSYDRVFHTIMTGADIKNVGVVTSQIGEFQVAFELTPNGAEIFKQYTTDHVGDSLAIVLDKRLISAPRINEPITDGQGVITGSFDNESANALAIQLRYGSLPIPLKVVEVRTVGPTLGQDSLQKSLLAGVIGFTIVILFMALYYRLPGILADISIIIYALITFAVFRFIPVTLTLPGIAGFLLSTGAALDANILIFERMKEELRGGKKLQQSIDIGWRRAWPSIRDSNIATLITCTILFWFGSTFGATMVKGFSITLALGVIVSLFTAIVVTRVLVNIVFSYFSPSNYDKWFGT